MIEIVLSSSLALLHGSAFVEAPLDSMSFQPGPSRFVVNYMLLLAQSEVVYCFRSFQSIVIPRNIEMLGPFSFFSSGTLEDITFESESMLREIGESAFAKSHFQRIHFPRSLMTIGKEAFSGCELLQSVTFDPGSLLQFVGLRAFSETKIKEVLIPLRRTCEKVKHRPFHR
jgi:hypothetical protein